MDTDVWVLQASMHKQNRQFLTEIFRQVILVEVLTNYSWRLQTGHDVDQKFVYVRKTHFVSSLQTYISDLTNAAQLSSYNLKLLWVRLSSWNWWVSAHLEIVFPNYFIIPILPLFLLWNLLKRLIFLFLVIKSSQLRSSLLSGYRVPHVRYGNDPFESY